MPYDCTCTNIYFFLNVQVLAFAVDHKYNEGDAIEFGQDALQEHGFFIMRAFIPKHLAKKGVRAIQNRVKEALSAHGVIIGTCCCNKNFFCVGGINKHGFAYLVERGFENRESYFVNALLQVDMDASCKGLLSACKLLKGSATDDTDWQSGTGTGRLFSGRFLTNKVMEQIQECTRHITAEVMGCAAEQLEHEPKMFMCQASWL